MYKFTALIFILLLYGCTNTSIILPGTGPITAKDESGKIVRTCQVVITNGKPETICTNNLNLFN